MNHHSDTEDSVSASSDDLLKDLLGGIVFDIEWKEEVESSNHPTVVPGRVDPEKTKHLPHSQSQQPTNRGDAAPIMYCSTKISLDSPLSSVYEFSYRCSSSNMEDGQVERPPVEVVNMASIGRGNALVTTAPIPRGSVIYTERAVAATQVPPIRIRACQYCYRSLEGIDALSETLPWPDLWPVPSLQFPNLSTGHSGSTPLVEVDHFGRLQCRSCGSLFCSAHHHHALEKELGGCCLVNRALKAVDAMDNTSSSAQAPVALASRLFCHCVQYYRTHEQSLTGHFLDGFCGDATDLDVLELGVYDKAKRCYTLDLLYGQLLDILSLSTTEQNTLSLEFLHKVAAQAARNGFGILTQSPFKTYYASLVRKSTTRDSKEHQANMKLVAQALGRESLERGMDRDIESKVAPEICAVFPLTARCNHSCAPNAQVRSQEFVDAHIDVVALRDLQPGEELLISYIPVGVGVGKRSTVQRRRELQAKYLFYCDCVRCTND